MISDYFRDPFDDYPALPWSRGGRTLFLCARPHCRGSASCPEAREHLLVPVQSVRRAREVR